MVVNATVLLILYLKQKVVEAQMRVLLGETGSRRRLGNVVRQVNRSCQVGWTGTRKRHDLELLDSEDWWWKLGGAVTRIISSQITGLRNRRKYWASLR